jgi:hypothetical protein
MLPKTTLIIKKMKNFSYFYDFDINKCSTQKVPENTEKMF